MATRNPEFPSFVPDKARPLASRPFLIPSIFVTCLLGSLLPQGRINTLSVTAITLYISSQIPKATAGKVTQDYMLPIQTALTILQWMDFYVFHSPDEFHRLKDKKNNEESPKTWRQKLAWAFDLNSTYRGIDWNWKVKNVPEALSTEKWTFVRTELSKAFAWYLLFDLCFYTFSRIGYTSVPAPDVFSESLPRQALLAVVTGIMNYCPLNMQYSIASALAVSTGLFSIQDWPPLMGRLKEVTTVRGFWSKFWHQNLRRKLTLPFNLLTRYVPIRGGTLVSRYTQLYMAFITTSLIHHVGAMNLSTSSNGNNMYQVAFFMLQPVSITLEDFVIYLGKKAGVKKSRLTRTLGHLWTFAWFTFTLRYAAAFLINTEFMSEKVMPSIIGGVLMLAKTYSNEPGLKEKL